MLCHYPSQTAPADLNSSSWEPTVEGQQNFLDYTDHGDVQADSEEYPFSYGHVTPRKDHAESLEDFPGKWTVATDSVPSAEPMRRVASKSSTGSSHKRRTGRSSPSKHRSRTTPRLSPESAPISSYDITGNALAYPDGSLPHARIMDVNHQYLIQDHEGLSVSALYSGMVGFPDGLPCATDLVPAISQHVDPACTQVNMDYEPSVASNSPPQSWGSGSSTSRLSSPGIFDDTWPQPLASSPTDTHPTCSPTLQGQSPRAHRKSGHALMAEDLNGTTMANLDDFSLPPAFSSRRQSSDGETARDHPLYKQAQPHTDGLFHCPWEGQPSCNHKPEKLKCNYDKFVDSHLKPYRCKNDSCENARFSSTACLLRHEREAHAMHGHGDKPYLCTYKGCERAQSGNGFPRQWNLKDHMRRVHHDDGASLQAGAGSPPPSGATGQTKGKKKGGRKSSKTASSGDSGASANKAVEAYEDWHKHRQALTTIVSTFTEPDEPGLLQYYQDAQQHLSAMSQYSARMISSQKPDLLHGPYLRSFPQQSG